MIRDRVVTVERRSLPAVSALVAHADPGRSVERPAGVAHPQNSRTPATRAGVPHQHQEYTA